MAIATINDMAGYPLEEWDEYGELKSATRKALIPFADTSDTVADLTGDSDGSLGAQYPGVVYVHCKGVKLKGVGQQTTGSPFPSYEKMELTISYTKVTLNETAEGEKVVEVGEYLTEDLQPLTEFISLDYRNFLWEDHRPSEGIPLKPGEEPGFATRGFEYVITRHFLPYIPVAILTSMGKVNSGPVVTYQLGLQFKQEQLLVGDPTLTRSFSREDGTKGWSLTQRFSYKEKGWNKFFRAESKVYENMYYKGRSGIHEVFEQVDFEGLLP